MAIVLIICFSSCYQQPLGDFSRKTDFNFDWKFKLTDDTTTLTHVPLSDDGWRDLRLPHDFGIEFSFDSTLEGATGYLPGGVGIYQKHFATPASPGEKSIYVLFDGVYNNSKYWLNGEKLGQNPYGYSPVYYDLTNLVKTDGSENVLTVHVDHSRYADSRWYTGGGIYRNVDLITVNKLHIPIWGTYITTPEVSEESASVEIEVNVENQNKSVETFTLTTRISDIGGNQVAEKSQEQQVPSGETLTFDQSLSVANPMLWDTENPNLYVAVTSIEKEGVLVDEYSTKFGIRSFLFDKDEGFFLNGKNTYVKGVCIHHDGGLVGTAVPIGVWKRRLQKLQEGGVNAVRTSHNPFSDEFLDLCDELGILVQNEIFDEMDNPKDKRFNKEEQEPLYITEGYDNHFQDWAYSDLKRTMLRDRNHASVFMWSIGNEIEWTYPYYKEVSGLWEGKGSYWNKIPTLTPEEMKARYEALPEREYVLAETAKKLSVWVKEFDTTRPVTANLIIPVASLATGYADALDVVGFSYQIAQYDWSKKHFPHMHFTGNENSGYLSEWKSVTEKPYVFSMYMWTGIDYLGESQDDWPQKAWPGDMMDLGGFTTPGWHNFKGIWVDEPHIAITTLPLEGSKFKLEQQFDQPVTLNNKVLNWQNYGANNHWNYNEGEMIIVQAHSNLEKVELFLDEKSLGSREMTNTPDRIFRWVVPFKSGRLTVTGKDASAELMSANSPAAINLEVDKSDLDSDGYDVAHLVLQLVDRNGVPVRHIDKEVTFEVKGDVKLLGVDNGSNKSTQDYQTNSVITSQGRCLAIIQSLRNITGQVKVTARVEGLEPAEIILTIK